MKRKLIKKCKSLKFLPPAPKNYFVFKFSKILLKKLFFQIFQKNCENP